MADVFLVVLCIMSYMNTMFSLTVFTPSTFSSDGGRVVGFDWFRTVQVYTISDGNQEIIFAMPDLTSYLIIGVVILNCAILFKSMRLDETVTFKKRLRNLSAFSIIISVLALISYAWSLMDISAWMKAQSPIGGRLFYQFPIYIHVVRVVEAMGRILLDVPLLSLFTAFVLSLIMVMSLEDSRTAK